MYAIHDFCIMQLTVMFFLQCDFNKLIKTPHTHIHTYTHIHTRLGQINSLKVLCYCAFGVKRTKKSGLLNIRNGFWSKILQFALIYFILLSHCFSVKFTILL